MKSIMIAGRRVGRESPCFIIAEAGVNHDGDADLAHRLIDVAADSGADAVKFQTFEPESLVSPKALTAPYQRKVGVSSQRDMLRQLTLPTTAWRDLASHAADRDLLFLSTAFDARSLDLLLSLGVPALKVPSGEVTNLSFIADLASHGLPLILSTGMASMEEVVEAYQAAEAAPAVALLHCVSAYPTPVECSNLRAIRTLGERFDAPVGWSDHTIGSVTAIAAVTLGASILEKHFTVDRTRRGPDHRSSADPSEFAEYISQVRATEASLGDGVKQPAEIELANMTFVRRSYHAVRDLVPGDSVRREDVRLLRPATGLGPGAEVVGRLIVRPVPAGHPLSEDDLE